MEGTANFSNAITNIFFEQADGILQDTATLDTTVNVLNPHAALGMTLIVSLLLIRKPIAAWLFVRCLTCHSIQVKSQKAKIL